MRPTVRDPFAHLIRPAATAVIALVLVAGCSSGDEREPPSSAQGEATSEVPADGAEYGQWLVDHPEDASIVVLRGDDPEPVLSVAPDELRPLASTRKVLVLLAVSEATTAGALDPADPAPLPEIERYHLPGTDGGAHESAVAELGADWTLADALTAMIVFSDNAATDWLLEQTGGPDAVDAVIADYDMEAQEPAWPYLGEYLAWSAEPEAWLAGDAAQRQQLAVDLTEQALGSDEPPSFTAPAIEDQRELAAQSARGTAAEWAQLMADVRDRAAAGDEVAATAVEVMSWPLAAEQVAEQFAGWATKGGSFSGVLTSATAIQPADGEPLVVVQLAQSLPADVEQAATEGFLFQDLDMQLALDPALVDRLAAG